MTKIMYTQPKSGEISSSLIYPVLPDGFFDMTDMWHLLVG